MVIFLQPSGKNTTGGYVTTGNWKRNIVVQILDTTSSLTELSTVGTVYQIKTLMLRRWTVSKVDGLLQRIVFQVLFAARPWPATSRKMEQGKPCAAAHGELLGELKIPYPQAISLASSGCLITITNWARNTSWLLLITFSFAVLFNYDRATSTNVAATAHVTLRIKLRLLRLIVT